MSGVWYQKPFLFQFDWDVKVIHGITLGTRIPTILARPYAINGCLHIAKAQGRCTGAQVYSGDSQEYYYFVGFSLIQVRGGASIQ